MVLATGSLQLGLLYGILALGIYISFRILNIPDLTTEGSFTFGLAVSAAVTAAGHPYAAIAAAILAGALAGSLTGILQTKWLVHPVLAGIITMTGLYSVNLFVLGGASNLSLVRQDTLFKLTASQLGVSQDAAKTILAILFTVVVTVLLIVFFKTRTGLAIRAIGDNEEMVRASSIHVEAGKTLAFALANGLVALSGGLVAQYQGYADVSSGMGLLVVGLASVIIGEAIIGRRGVTLGFLSAVAGSLLYRFIIALTTKYSPFPAYMLKLVSAVIVAVALMLPAMQFYWERRKIRKEGMKHAGNETCL